MQITLTYQGPLPSRQQAGAAAVKARLRVHFSNQLVTLWHSHVKAGGTDDDEAKQIVSVGGQEFGHLVVEEAYGIGMRLQVLLLAREGTLREGDLDNRLKTLTDAFTIPPNPEQSRHDVENGRDRIVCLMRDDKQVKSIAVDRRQWLEPGFGAGHNDVHVVVTASTFAVGPVTWGGVPWIG